MCHVSCFLAPAKALTKHKTLYVYTAPLLERLKNKEKKQSAQHKKIYQLSDVNSKKIFLADERYNRSTQRSELKGTQE